MSIFDKILKREESQVPETAVENQTEQNQNSPQDLLLTSMLRGEKITKDKAMSIPAISSAVDRISSIVAMLPVKLYQKEPDKKGIEKIVEVKDDVRTKLLNNDTGDLLDPFQLKKAIVRDYLTDKGAYIFIEKDKNDLKLSVKIVYNKEVAKEKYPDSSEEDLRKIIWEQIKEINKTFPPYKYIKNMILTDEELIKTTTKKVKRQEELKRILG